MENMIHTALRALGDGPVVPMALEATRNHATTMIIGGVTLLIAIIVLIVVIARIRALRRVMARDSERFGAAMASAFDYICEINLTEDAWDNLNLVNGKLVKSRMHETLYEYIDRYCKEWVAPDDRAQFRELFKPESLQAMSDQNSSTYFEYRRRNPAGGYRWCSLVAQGIMRRTRKEASVVMLYIRDIDNSKQEEEKGRRRLQEALQNAEKLSSYKSDFMSRISHEIRTPLNAIMGFLTIAKQNIGQPDKLENCLNKADIASHHLLSLIGNVLDISAIESGKLKIDHATFNFKEFIGNLGSIFFENARQKGVEFSIHIKEVTEEYLVGDSMRLNQVLMNLISNALKFTEKGGHVSLTIRQAGLMEDSVHLQFIVQDDGIGMSDAFMARIFQAFEQEESATARHYGGSGLGLSIVKNMTNVMGGTVDVQSKQGEGSTFIVALPFGRSRCELTDEAVRRAYQGLRVLVVDDDGSSLEYASLLLKKLAIAHDTAVSGDVALQKAQRAMDEQKPYDLFLVDWRMPGMSGAETAKRLRAMAGDAPHIVIVSGYDQSMLEAETTGLHISKYIMKPLFQSTLVDLLGDLAGRQEASETVGEPDLPDFAGKRVLLVEDNELNREIALELLEQVGLQVDGAENGQEGSDRFIQSEPGVYDLVLMDIQMPIMDGHAAARRIRASAHPQAQTVPIIAMTANAFPEDISQSLASGMNNHLSKPIDTQVMYKLLAQYLNKQEE